MLKGIRKKASLLGGSPLRSHKSDRESSYQNVLKEVHDFEIALQAMDLLLDDRNDEGTRLLKNAQKDNGRGPAAIFPLALGVMEFIEATLGFETEVMERAHKTLSAAEEASLVHMKYNQKLQLATSHIYPPGTEFQVTYAELTLLNALIMLLQENNGVMEQMKALLKLRRAYQTLEATYKRITELEGLFSRNLAKFRAAGSSVSLVDLPGFDPACDREAALMENLERVYQMRKKRVEGTCVGDSLSQVNLFCDSTVSLVLSLVSATKMMASLDVAGVKLASKYDTEDSDSDEFADASDTFDSHTLDVGEVSVVDYAKDSVSYSESGISGDSAPSTTSTSTHLHVSTIDEFIHSGVQLCFGILQVVLSLIPPTIGKVLSIVGFKGNRDTGLRMLWRTAITSRNIHGELALLCLLVFYDGPIQFIDMSFQLPGHEDENVAQVLDLAARSTVSDSEISAIVANPNLYTPQLLVKARRFFPHNALWLLQEGRMHAAQGNIYHSLRIMQNFTDGDNDIRMEQVDALLTFDRGMFYAFVHDYDAAARDFLHMLDINSWSKAVYLFMAGACYAEKWRMIQSGIVKFASETDAAAALAEYSRKAEKYLKLAPTYVPGHGANAAKKNGGIGGSNKQMPFDKFVLRKLGHMDERARKHPQLLYVECIGTSLIHELVYFWNAYNRMPQQELELLRQMLGFSAGPQAKFAETRDEAMIRKFLSSVVLRQLSRADEGCELLDSVMAEYVSDSATFKFTKMTYSPYLYPTALYERAMFAWVELKNKDTTRAITEGLAWMKKAEIVADVGDYELSNRTSMKIKAAAERLELIRD